MKTKVMSQQLKSYYKNKEKILKKMRGKYVENPLPSKLKSKITYISDKDKVKKRVKNYQIKKPEIMQKAVKKWILKNPEKTFAHQELYKAIKRKEILPANKINCIRCGKNAQHYHHEDYSKPFEVIPVCAECHKEIHNER